MISLALAAALSAAAVPAPAPHDTGQVPYTAADVQFMSGMIVHHAQAILIAGWAPSHDASVSLRKLCERIVVGQRDEIATMQRWLLEHHETVPAVDTLYDPMHQHMAGMDHPMLMPGMLTDQQLAALNAAQGVEFDRLFLTDMIQHHRGALTMVDQLLKTPGAAQDGRVFRFAADVNVDQTTEIDRMTQMLAALPPATGGHRP
jgi:uncharacterized protein (DUF305 family)